MSTMRYKHFVHFVQTVQKFLSEVEMSTGTNESDLRNYYAASFFKKIILGNQQKR